MELPKDTGTMTDNEFRKHADTCSNFLRERVSYCFINGRDPLASWTLATWSSKIQRCHIQKYGSDSDIAYLAPVTSRNKPHAPPKKQKIRTEINPLHPSMQQKRMRNMNRTQTKIYWKQLQPGMQMKMSLPKLFQCPQTEIKECYKTYQMR